MQRLVERQHLSFNPELDFNKIQITQGAQQAIFCVLDAMINPGDVIFVASSTYLGFINVAIKFGAITVGIPTDNEDMIIEQIERGILTSIEQMGKKPKLIFVIATSDNPKGTKMSLKRRK